MPILRHDDWLVSVESPTWAEILRFLSSCGWGTTMPMTQWLTGNCTVSSDDAAALAAAGRIVLEETLKDPMGACSTIKFDMGKFAEIVEFASEGSFVIERDV
jgi:hypothetical protein